MTVSVSDSAPIFTDVVFTLDGLDVSASITRAAFTATAPQLSAKTLAGKRAARGTTEHVFEVEGLQDYGEAQNFCSFLNEHVGEEATAIVTWTFRNGETSQRSATVILAPADWGGTADELATFSVSLDVNGSPTATDTAGS